MPGRIWRARRVLASLERACLYCVDLRGADARGANFHRADLRGVSLRNANYSRARLDEADIRQDMLARADVPEGFRLMGGSASVGGEMAFAVDFANSSMHSVRLAKARLKGDNFSGGRTQRAA